MARQNGVANGAILFNGPGVAHLRRLVELFEVIDRTTSLLLQCFGLEKVLLGRVARDPHRWVRLLKFVELLTYLDLR